MHGEAHPWAQTCVAIFSSAHSLFWNVVQDHDQNHDLHPARGNASTLQRARVRARMARVRTRARRSALDTGILVQVVVQRLQAGRVPRSKHLLARLIPNAECKDPLREQQPHHQCHSTML